MKLAPFDLTNENYNIGHLCMDALRINPDAVYQIDAATGQSETNASVLARSIQLARCFRKLGAKPGDVLALGGKKHLDLHIPYFAAIMNGMPVAGVDPFFKKIEIQKLFKICSPRIAFCQKEFLDIYHAVKEEMGLNTEIICFDEGEHSLSSFIDKYDDKEDQKEFLPVIVDQNKHYVWLVSTGGTSGVVKLAATTHRSLMKKIESLKLVSTYSSNHPNNENKFRLNISPVQWLSAFLTAIASPLMRKTNIQTSNTLTTDHLIDIINQYRPGIVYWNPVTFTGILKSEKKCDLTCFDTIVVLGAKCNKSLLLELRKRVRPGAIVMEVYGQTENLGAVLIGAPEGPIGNCGKELSALLTVKIVDPETGKEITEPNVPGELWTKGASFSEYYNNPEETAASFTEDGWYRTGDILYRDENGYFFFVERLKMLIKCRIYHVIPADVEEVIREHPGVRDVSVTSVPHEEDGEHPVACVVRNPGSNVTADEIKEIVANKLSDSQRLRGGVVFMDQLPMTSAGKLARGELRKLVLTLHRE
ncbi:hypothetical protein PYW08_008094 [Mythimna loreyi]|uniref:Uncharacterized protein n=1 Tax=Mythimna loreyi TaxID=667449 RepID=A0ACC2QCX0_9NEOP|nr:hypothetical protein PYW08_008094 [Mythimna loreyi]